MASVCRAAIKEEETSGEMKVGQNWGGGVGGREREAACASSPRTNARTHLWHLAVHVCTYVHASPHPPLQKNKKKTKNKYPPPAPITKHQNEKRGWGRQEKCGAQQTAPPRMGRSQSLHWREVRHPSTPATNPATQSMGLTLQISYSGILNQNPSYWD